MMSLRRVLAVAKLEVRRLLRSQMTFTLLILVPAMQVILFGYAIRPNASSVSIAIAAETTEAAERIAREVAREKSFKVVASGLMPGGSEAMVRARRALIGIEAPKFRTLDDPLIDHKPLRIFVDASNPALVGVAIERIQLTYWRKAAMLAGAEEDWPAVEVERLYNPDMRADWNFLPSLAGVTVMISMIMLGSISVARERENGTYETLISLPITPFDALGGKLLPYTIIGTLQGGLVLFVGVVLFGLPMRTSVIALMPILPVFAAAHLSIGYAISARAATQMAALQGAVAFYLPAMLLSGFLFPFDALPRWAQSIGSVFPLTHFIRAAQGGVLRGDSAVLVLSHAIPMIAFLGVAICIATFAHARRLD